MKSKLKARALIQAPPPRHVNEVNMMRWVTNEMSHIHLGFPMKGEAGDELCESHLPRHVNEVNMMRWVTNEMSHIPPGFPKDTSNLYIEFKFLP
jgi:hypothetical protein